MMIRTTAAAAAGAVTAEAAETAAEAEAAAADLRFVLSISGKATFSLHLHKSNASAVHQEAAETVLTKEPQDFPERNSISTKRSAQETYKCGDRRHRHRKNLR